METGCLAYHRLCTQWATSQSLSLKHLEIKSHTPGDVTTSLPQELGNGEAPRWAVNRKSGEVIWKLRRGSQPPLRTDTLRNMKAARAAGRHPATSPLPLNYH